MHGHRHGHGAFAGRERTHALVIGELVVSDVEPTTFVRALHPHRGEDGVHRRVPHVEATAALALLALPLVLGALNAAVRASQVPYDNTQVKGIIIAISKGGSDKYGVSNPQGAKGKINILSSPICH